MTVIRNFQDFNSFLKFIGKSRQHRILTINVCECSFADTEKIFKVLKGEFEINSSKKDADKSKYESAISLISGVKVIIPIEKLDDFDNYFIKKFCDKNKKFISLFSDAEFSFKISVNWTEYKDNQVNNKFDEIVKNYFKSCKKIDGYLRIVLSCQDIWSFLTDSKEAKKFIAGSGNGKVFVTISDSEKDNFEEWLRRCVLFGQKYRDYLKSRGYIIRIEIQNKFYEVQPYVSALLDNYFKVWAKDINDSMNNVKAARKFVKVPPMLFIRDSADLLFLQQPIDKVCWDKIRNYNSKINGATFEKNKNATRYWQYLYLCQRFLFDKFVESNACKEYITLRQKVFAEDSFYNKYVSKIPMLALLLFSMYDNFYRSDILAQAKSESYYNSFKLKTEDILLSKQEEQKYEKFENYKKNQKNADIKNLVKTSFNGLEEVHPTVISEIVECVSLAEGLLQLLENAKFHANGGLLSFRIYSRRKGNYRGKLIDKKDEDYLYNNYGKGYFSLIDTLVSGTNYFLEVNIMDLSDSSIPEKFYKNYSNTGEKGYSIVQQLKNENLLNLKYFFAPSAKQCNYKEKFYKSPENRVHHYGLDVFNNIVTNRNGIFSVCGYRTNDKQPEEYSYSNVASIYEKIYKREKLQTSKFEYFNIVCERLLNADIGNIINELRDKEVKDINDKITTNQDIKGTNYRILLPLNHSYNGNSVISGDKGGIKQKNDLINEFVLVDVTDKLPDDIKTESIQDKKSNINTIKKSISSAVINQAVLDKYPLVCVDFGNLNKKNLLNKHFEEIIKGILLWAMESVNTEFVLPISVVNLSEFQILVASKLIATYYTKSAVSLLSKIQIYLKSDNLDYVTDIVFAGNSIEEIKHNMLKTAMVNGLMYKEVASIIHIIDSISQQNDTSVSTGD